MWGLAQRRAPAGAPLGLLVLLGLAAAGRAATTFDVDLENDDTQDGPAPINPLEGVALTVSWDGTAGEPTEWPVCEPGGSYSRPHKVYCDRYFTCQHGQPYLGQCLDGYGFVLYKGCRLLHEMSCESGTRLQAPKGRGACERLFGIYADPSNCNRFYKCDNSTAVPDSCPKSLIFDNQRKICRTPTDQELADCEKTVVDTPQQPVEPDSPMRPVLFKCPVQNILEFGDHSRHPYPGNCKFFIMCLRDGTMKVGSCEPKTAYNPVTSNCDPVERVPKCSGQPDRQDEE
ncbi:hypothetical protein ONE63_004126 [Megalurothrips usitatus]|uniref:Chitin-binding type-2 domain-containing protein n=1 Tax=Megalurothrips usitatus TaxID=439358 RepID=A0AAV7X5X0_9NEOP|nr:hypothetical protein ONE63_004126 [Megalurothrips usitatus]